MQPHRLVARATNFMNISTHDGGRIGEGSKGRNAKFSLPVGSKMPNGVILHFAP